MSWKIISQSEVGDFVDIVVSMTHGTDITNTTTLDVNYRYPKSFVEDSKAFEQEIERAYRATFNL